MHRRGVARMRDDGCCGSLGPLAFFAPALCLLWGVAGDGTGCQLLRVQVGGRYRLCVFPSLCHHYPSEVDMSLSPFYR